MKIDVYLKKIACGALRNLNVFETNKPTVTEELDGDFFLGERGPRSGRRGPRFRAIWRGDLGPQGTVAEKSCG